eukprot:scaffold134577_cov63-Cyclotella_meneghiniana.AAC.1
MMNWRLVTHLNRQHQQRLSDVFMLSVEGNRGEGMLNLDVGDVVSIGIQMSGIFIGESRLSPRLSHMKIDLKIDICDMGQTTSKNAANLKQDRGRIPDSGVDMCRCRVS